MPETGQPAPIRVRPTALPPPRFAIPIAATRAPLPAPALRLPDTVHVFAVPLQIPSSSLRRLEGLLSPAERERAGRFHALEDRRRAIISRGTTRLLLGHYLQTSPGTLVLEEGPHGKPQLAGDDRPPIQFNSTHSGDWVAVVLSATLEVGIDVEFIRPVADLEAVAMSHFSEEEFLALMRLPREARLHAFFLGWTRKEAYGKAVGLGLPLPPGSFQITVDPEVPPALRAIDGDPEAATGWSLHHFQPDPLHAGAIAVSSPSPSLTAQMLTDF